MKSFYNPFYKLVRFGISVVYFPLINHLGYSKKDVELGLPNSHYFEGEDSLGSLNQIHKRYLKQTGWIESKNSNQSVRNGKYIPWTSYAFTHWIEQRNLSDLSMLEFGSGASTIFWAEKFKHVVAIETHPIWSKEVQKVCSTLRNVTILDLLVGSEQSPIDRSATENQIFVDFTNDLNFFPELDFNFNQINLELIREEIVKANYFFVDGGPRNLYMNLIAKFAPADSIVIVDNSDQPYTMLGRNNLRDSSFKEIEFRSLGPLNHSATSTSVFMKNFNQL